MSKINARIRGTTYFTVLLQRQSFMFFLHGA